MRQKSVIATLLATATAAAAAAVIALLALADSESRSAASVAARSGRVTIRIKDFRYHPASVTVTTGTTITFIDEDNVEHTATSIAEGVFETGALHKGQSASFTLRRPGTYPYHCSFHEFMHGVIKVVAR